MGRPQMPPLSLWLKGFRNGTQRQVCTNILSPQFIHSSLRSRSGEIMCSSRCSIVKPHADQIY
jgi:hypothetical protein